MAWQPYKAHSTTQKRLRGHVAAEDSAALRKEGRNEGREEGKLPVKDKSKNKDKDKNKDKRNKNLKQLRKMSSTKVS